MSNERGTGTEQAMDGDAIPIIEGKGWIENRSVNVVGPHVSPWTQHDVQYVVGITSTVCT